MKIVYCIPSTFNSGGMERILSVKASYLAEILGHDITIITTEQKDKKPFFKFSSDIRTIDLAINYREYKKNKLLEILSFPFLVFKHKKRLEKQLKQIKPDIVVSMFQEEAFILPKIKDGSIKLIEVHFSRNYRYQFNNTGIKKIINNLRTIRDEKIIKKYSKFICLTNEDKQDWPNLSNIMVIPNPVTLSQKPKMDVETKNRNGIKNVLAVGRICHVKGFTRLIEIWRHVESSYPDWTLTIIGNQDDISYVNKIISLIDKYKLKNIILKSPTNDICREFDSSSILVMTSLSEGMPLTLIEAMYMGLPLISFDFKCGPKDIIINSYNGFLVQNNQIEDFADKIGTLIKDDELRKEMSHNSLIASKNYELKNIMEKWDALFKSLI